MSKFQVRTSGKMRKTLHRVVAIVLSAVVLSAMPGVITVEATSISAIQNQINKDQQNLNNINNHLSELADEQDLIEEMIADLNSEILNMMTSISLKEDEIASKEQDIVNKQVEIDQMQLEYEAAKNREEVQYQAMRSRIRLMYENDSLSMFARILESTGLSGLINAADYIEKIYKVDNELLNEYEATKNHVHDLWDQLVLEKQQLENDKAQLERDRAYLQTLKVELDGKLAKKKQESANYEAEIKKYQKQAEAAKKKIQEEQKTLKKLQEEQKKQQQQANSAATNGNYTDTGYASLIDGSSGSDLGKKIAKYGCQFIGNPYVYGGTSLTNGADCSGFVYRIYGNFGYSLPRTSYEQRSAGSSVSYDEAQPGDLICYDGHVGMYIGGGKIVHASNAKTGIKVSNATYRPILAVRRIV